MTVISALLLGAPFAVHYALHKVRAKVHMITFDETQTDVKAVFVKVRDDRVVEMGLLHEDGKAESVDFGKRQEDSVDEEHHEEED